MLKKSLLLMTVISLNILPSFASDDQSDEKKSFFPQNFSKDQWTQLYTKGEATEGFKVYRVDEENKKKLTPNKSQILTNYTNPLEERLCFKEASYEEDEKYEIEMLPGMKEMGILKTFKGIYTLPGAYAFSSINEINVVGSYDVFRPIFSHGDVEQNPLCLHVLYEFDATFIKQTSGAHRINQTLMKFFYVHKALQQPEIYPLDYNEVAKIAGRTWFVEYMKSQKMSDEICLKMLFNHEDIRLENEFYTTISNSLKNEIYLSLGIDTALLESMYAGLGWKKISLDRT